MQRSPIRCLFTGAGFNPLAPGLIRLVGKIGDYMELKELKCGSFFTLKDIKEPLDFQVWVREYYDRENKVYVCHNYSDVNRFRSFKGNKKVFVDFIF